MAMSPLEDPLGMKISIGQCLEVGSMAFSLAQAMNWIVGAQDPVSNREMASVKGSHFAGHFMFP